MAPLLLAAYLLLSFTSTVVYSKSQASGRVVVLEDGNFDAQTAEGTWLIDIYAPWCPHCVQIEPVWRSIAKHQASRNVHVAKIDGTVQRVLMQRFYVTAFPSIFLLKDGQAWRYNGAVDPDSIDRFVTGGYKLAKAEPFYHAPNSLFGRAKGQLLSLPARAAQLYQHLRHERGHSDLAIVGIVLGVPVTIGAAMICALDAYYTRRSLHHEHHE